MPEALESRLLLYSKLGDQLTYDSRITYSFMPDGTSVGGVSERAVSDPEQEQFRRRPGKNRSSRPRRSGKTRPISTWRWFPTAERRSAPRATSKTTLDSATFASGIVPLASGVLAETFLPPPANGGTDAGDILLNSNVNWQINSNYDLMTVVAHEFGHALGLGDSTVSDVPVMYGTYNGINQALASDDIAGIQSIYGARSSTPTTTTARATITYLDRRPISTRQSAAMPRSPSHGLDITTAGDTEWFYVTVPSTTTGTMTVTVQSSNLSSLSPKLLVYNSSLSLVGQASAANSMGATVSVSTSVAAGQGYYIKVLAAGRLRRRSAATACSSTPARSRSRRSRRRTLSSPQQPDQGGGSLNNGVSIVGPTVPGGNSGQVPLPVFTTIGGLSGWAEVYSAPVPAAPVVPVQPSVPPAAPSPLTVIPPASITVLDPPAAPTVATPTTHAHHPRGASLKLLRWAAAHRVKHVKEPIKIKASEHRRPE